MQRRATELEEKLLQNEGLVKRLQQETVFLERQHMDVMSEVGCAWVCGVWMSFIHSHRLNESSS